MLRLLVFHRTTEVIFKHQKSLGHRYSLLLIRQDQFCFLCSVFLCSLIIDRVLFVLFFFVCFFLFPKVMFDSQGRIVVNPNSTVHVPESNVIEEIDQSNVVEETTTRVTSASYTKRPKALRWSTEETYTFYMGLRQYGKTRLFVSCF